ncbi:MAG: TolC family protein, partial [Rikenellaceae bacterium]
MSKFLIVIASLFWVATSFAANTLETLSSCLRSGLENSYSLQIVRNEEQAHHNNATRANAGQLPTVYIDGDYSSDFDKTKYSSNGTTTRTTPTEHDWSLGLSAAWTVFDGFRIEAAYDRLMELKRQSIITTRVELENYIAGLAAEYYNYIH